MKSFELPNFGYIIQDVPNELFESLKVECDNANKARYDLSIQKEEMHSGLSARGVPKHFYVKENLQQLEKFALDTSNVYCKEFPLYVPSFKMLSHSVPFSVAKPWINIQEKTEYIPNHTHDGILSYIIWISIPYDINEETKDQKRTTSKLQFTYTGILGNTMDFTFSIDKSYQGKIMMFPSLLCHCVYPFYSSSENRISVSGNIVLDTSKYAL